MSAVASRTVSLGRSVIGLRIMPLSDRFTRSTSAACRSIDMFLWSTPMPPARAIAIAISDSVTVSIAAETSGTRSSMPRVKREIDRNVFGVRERMARDEQDVVERERELIAHARGPAARGAEDAKARSPRCPRSRAATGSRVLVAMVKSRRGSEWMVGRAGTAASRLKPSDHA